MADFTEPSPSPLSLDDLSRLASCDPDRIRGFEAAGLIASAGDGTFDHGDVSRVRLLLSLERSGLDLDRLAEEVRGGRISLQFAGQLVADEVGMSETRYDDALAELGLDMDFTRRLRLAIGLPSHEPGELVREDDLELFKIVATALKAGIDRESLLAAMRVFGMGIRQIVEVQRELFRENVEDRMLKAGLSYPEMLEAAAPNRLRLQRLGYRTVFLLLRRFLEQAAFQNLFERFEETLEEHDVSRTTQKTRTIAFADLSGYTQLTEASGDAQAAEHGARLMEIALDLCATNGGRVVKSLGDGAMLHFHTPGVAVATCVELVARAKAEGLAPLRAGIASGPVVQRDGDYYGRTVNLAARLVRAAEPGQVLVSAAVALAVSSEVRTVRAAGVRDLAGVRDPVPVFAMGHAA